jgi:large subunit ribosomal protein L10
MTKEQKYEVVQELVAKLKTHPNFYVLNAGGMTVEQINAFRRKCFESNMELRSVKNTLIIKALGQVDGDFQELTGALAQSSSILFAPPDAPKEGAKMLKAYRKGSDKPLMKAAYVQESTFVGDDQLDALLRLKSKQELIGEVIGLLQSPARNVVSALQSGGQKIAGILKTLSEKDSE